MPEKELRSRTVQLDPDDNERVEANTMNRRPFAPPPVFRGKGDEDLGDWLHLYERYGLALAWTDAEKADNLVFALEDVARRWYVTALRENRLKTWEDWRTALKENFSGDHVREWAYIQLQQRQQQLGETPQEYVSGILQLCARVNPEMPESEKLRHLLRGLRPEMMERVAITNPGTSQEFLQHLQRLTHVGAMARHALMAMPTHPLPGRHTDTFPLTVQDTSSRVDSVGMLNEPSTVLYAPTRQETPDKSTVAALNAMQETLRALTAAVDRLGQQDRRPFPRRTSRNTNGQVICFRCNRSGHIARQCNEPIAPPQTHDHPGN